MIIDSHQHVFWKQRDDAFLVADLDEQGIDVAWLLTWNILPSEDFTNNYYADLNPLRLSPDGTHQGVPLEDLLLCKQRYPNRFLLGYCPHPLAGDAPALLEAAYHMYGVRICGEWKFRIPFDDPRCLNLYRKAGQLKCPVVLHLDVPYRPDEPGTRQYDDQWYGGTVDNLRRALAACGETIFIGHGPGFWREISGNSDAAPEVYPPGPVVPGGRLVSLFADHANLYADLSANSALIGLRRDPQHARDFLEKHADRLLFGRDCYGGDLQAFLATLELPADVSSKIFCDNAERLVPVEDAL